MNPIKLYVNSQKANLDLIRTNPVQGIAINAIALVAGYGMVEMTGRRKKRKFEKENPVVTRIKEYT